MDEDGANVTAPGWHTIEMAGTGSEQIDFITVARDGTLYLGCNAKKLDTHKVILKQAPSAVMGEVYVRAGPKNYDVDSSTLESLNVQQFMGLWCPTDSDALLFSDHTRIKSIEDQKVKTVVKTDFPVGKFVCLSETDIWFLSSTQALLYRAKNGSYKRVSGYASNADHIGNVDGPLEFARYSNPTSSTLTISKRSGAIYIAQKTRTWCGIRRIRNGFVQLLAGGTQTSPPDVHNADGPIHLAKLTAIHGIAVNAQEDVVIGAQCAIRLVSNGQVVTIFQSPPSVVPHWNYVSTSPDDIIYTPSRFIMSQKALEKQALKRPSSYSPSGISFSDYSDLLRERSSVAHRDPLEQEPVFADPTLELLLYAIDPRLDPKKYVTISIGSGKVWNLHTAVLQLRCPYLLKENVRSAFAALSEEAQAFILGFIFGDRIPDASLVDDAEFDHAATLCGLSRLSDYLRQRFSQLIRIPKLPLFDFLVELLRKWPDEVSRDFVDLIVAELKQRTQEIPERIEQLRQLFPDPEKTKSVISKLQGSISMMVLYMPPTSNSQAPVGDIFKVIAPLLPWVPRIATDKLSIPTPATLSLSASTSNLREPSSAISLSASGSVPLKTSGTTLKLTKPTIPADFTLTCRGVSFPCHKWLLLARWAYFRNILSSNEQEEVPIILSIDSVPVDFLEALLIYIYTGDTIVFADIDRCVLFFQLGPDLGLLEADLSATMEFFVLRDFCLNFASHDLDCATVLKKLQISRMVGDKDLRLSCLKFIIGNLPEILSTPGSVNTWSSLGADILIHCYQKQFVMPTSAAMLSLSSSSVISSKGSLSSSSASWPAEITDLFLQPTFFVDTVAGSGRKGLRNGAALFASFNNPTGIDVSFSGEIFVSDSDNHVIRSFRPGGKTRTVAGKGVEGYNYGTFDKAQFALPLGLALSPEGEAYVADHNNDRIRVLRFGEVKTFAGVGRKKSPSLKFSDSPTALKSSEITLPTALCFHASTIYATQTARHAILVLADNSVSVYAGASTPLHVSSPGEGDASPPTASHSGTPESFQFWKGYEDGMRTSARFDSPHGICVTGAGDLYIADSGNHCIRFVNVAAVTTFAGVGKIMGFKDGPAREALFNYPTGVCLGKDERVYVADCANHRIRMILGGHVTSIGGNGVGSFADGFGPSSSFCFPTALAMGSSGEIYVTDSANHRIRVLSEITLQAASANSDLHSPASHSRLQLQSSSHKTGIRIFPPIKDLRQLYEIADIKWVHRASTSEFLLHSPILKLRTPELLDPSSEHAKDLLNSTVSDASFNYFVDFLYSDELPETLSWTSFLEVVHLLSICGNANLICHAQYLLFAKFDQITDETEVKSVIRTLLSLETATPVLDMLVPKLRSTPELANADWAQDPTMPHSITDLLRKVEDPTQAIAVAPTTSPVLTAPLTSIIASMLPPHDLLKIEKPPSVPSSYTSLDEDQIASGTEGLSKAFLDRGSSSPPSTTLPSGANASNASPGSGGLGAQSSPAKNATVAAWRNSYAFPTVQKPAILRDLPPDTLVSFGKHKIACHSWILMTRWPHLKLLVADVPLVQQGLLPEDSIPGVFGAEHVLSKSISKTIELPQAPAELIAAIITHLYTGSYSDLDRLNSLVVRYETALGIPTNATTDDEGWTLMGSPDPLSLHNCAFKYSQAIKTDSDVDIANFKSFILRNLGVLLCHPSLAPTFRKSLTSDTIASFIMELYGQVWPFNPT